MPAQRTLRLFVAPDQHVWYGDERVLAVDSGMAPEPFVRSGLFLSADVVRVLGRLDNAPLLLQLGLHLRGDPARRIRIQVGSPTLCPQSASPTEGLGRMWRAAVCNDLFVHWYELNERDYTTHALQAAWLEAGQQVNQTMLQTLPYHPAWPALSFASPHAEPAQLARLLVTIGDPRWFAHPEHPGRLSRLFEFLGLTPRNMTALWQRLPGGRHFDRARLAVSCWLGPQLAPIPSTRPAEFLSRIFIAASTAPKGLLLATHRYVRLIREVWLARRSAQPEVVFVPEMFFRTPREVEAFRHHLDALTHVPVSVDTP